MAIPAAEAAAAQTVIVRNKQLRAPVFTSTDDPLRTAQNWEIWLEGIEREFRFFQITENEDKVDALLIYGGEELARMNRCLEDPAEGNCYQKLKSKLNSYYLPAKNKQHARYKFLKLRPEANESVARYTARLREKAGDCEFEDQDERILEHLIQTLDNDQLIQKALSKRWNLGQFLTNATQFEDIKTQVKDMRGLENKVALVKFKSCDYCGKEHAERNCPAYGKECNKCHKLNHFAKVCKQTLSQNKKLHTPKYANNFSRGRGQYRGRGGSRRRYSENDAREMQHPASSQNYTERQFSGYSRHPRGYSSRYARGRGRYQGGRQQVNKIQGDSSDSDEFFSNSTHHLREVKKLSSKTDNEKNVRMKLNDVYMHMEADSGADVNVMDEKQFLKYMQLQEEINKDNSVILRQSNVKLRTLQNELKVKGQFDAMLANRTQETKTQFIVIEGKIDSNPLIGRETLIRLGMLKIDPEGRLNEQNIKNVEKQDAVQEMLCKYENVFKGIGKIRDVKNNKDIFGKFNMIDTEPVTQKPRHVAYYLQQPLKKWLEEAVEEEIFEHIPEGEAVTWCSPLVVQPKPRFKKVDRDKLEPHMIRASVDLRVVNKFMQRSRITVSPILEDFTYTFNNCKVFSKLDMTKGYHQLMMDEESRNICTFSTPWGNMRPKRLIFGAKASQDIFDEKIYRIFNDIPRCLNQRDDILIGGENVEDHNATLEKVLKRAQDYGITFRKEKCEFAVTEIEFYGYKFTDKGLKITEEKVKAVKNAAKPESKDAIKSFLGMVGYLSKFIPNYAAITAPLRRVTHKDTKFVWRKEQQQAFEKLKDSITSQDTMQYFNPRLAITVRTEASFNEGLSAGLFQAGKPVHYISRTMTDTEKRYSQTEKDALAIKWAKNRFSMYLMGAPKFKIVTAHKPLIPMFNKPMSKLPPRIEKWVMDMQDVEYEVIYEPGKDEQDPLDYLSRHPLPETGSDSTEKVIKQIILAEHAIVMADIIKATKEDEVLQTIIEKMLTHKWEDIRRDPELAPYYHVRDELYQLDGMVMRLNKIVLPSKLQAKALKAAHSLGHLGITKTKNMLRNKYWFPRLNTQVERMIRKCFECQVVGRKNTREPVKMTEIPKTTWHTVAADFGGPYPDGHYNLVVIDKRSRYPAVETVYSTAFKPTKRALKTIFSTYGIPRRIETDNGPPFNSSEFKQFAQEEGFEHHLVTPHHAQANGTAESFMKMLNKTEQIANLSYRDRAIEIQNMLMGYRATPHPSHGKCPYDFMVTRGFVRTKLDKADIAVKIDQEEVDRKDWEYKNKIKNNAENRSTSEHNFKLDGLVLVKQKKTSKLTTAFEPNFYKITEIRGSQITARNSSGRKIVRDASHFKDVSAVVDDVEMEERHILDRIPERCVEKDLPMEEPIDVNPNKPDTDDTDEEDDGDDKNTNTEIRTPRPQRATRRPAYLNDYVV